MNRLLILLTGILLTISTPAIANEYQGEIRWWKGNTHTHTWWSDGDAPPEIAADWYKSNGYNFLVLSEHNVMAEGVKWYRLRTPTHQLALEKYKNLFGEDWVEERKSPGRHEVKLKPLAEYRALFEEAGEFIFIPGEEITDGVEGRPVHVNGVNLIELIMPRGGNNVANAIKNNINAVRAQSMEFQQPMFAHLNHPNFHYSNRVEDFWDVKGKSFFEIFNGHPSVNNFGNDLHPSSERMWDITLAKRLGEFDMDVIYGVGSDDTHNYMDLSSSHSNYGRGWVMVRAKRLTPNTITEAMKRGDFYISTGVTLKDVKMEGRTLSLAVDEEEGVNYTIQFIGTKKGVNLVGKPRTSSDDVYTSMKYSNEIGIVLKEVEGTTASYTANGDELYVRAKIMSDKPKENPIETEKFEMAYSQPLVVR